MSTTVLVLSAALGAQSCKGDPVRRSSSDAGLSLLADGGVDGGLGTSGRPGAVGALPEGEQIPGLEGLGIDPGQLGPGLLSPGLADAGLSSPGLGLGTPIVPAGLEPVAGAAGGGLVGKPCASNADCGPAPAFCIPADSAAEFRSGGPQGGFCSLPCASNAECLGVDRQSACNTELGFCLGVCSPGASDAKCDLERPLACVPQAAAAFGVCLPTCTSDAACGSGRFCDLGATGTCRELPPAGGPVGSPCTRETEGADCAGDICLTFRDPLDGVTPVGSFCSANCTFGRVDGCGFDTLSSGPRSAACLQAQDPGGAPGDLGYCFELCDDDGDCEQSGQGWLCESFPDPGSAEALGRAGRCLPGELASEPGFPGLPEDEPGLPELPGFSERVSR